MTRRAAMVGSSGSGRRAVAFTFVGAALLVPWQVTAESGLQTGARTAGVGATAHLDFKIVIPPVLALSIDSAGVPVGAAPRVSIFSNSRHVLVAASIPATADERSLADRPVANGAAVSPPSGSAAERNVGDGTRTVLLTASRHFVINAQTGCRLAGPRRVASTDRPLAAPIVDQRPVICTVAMP
jgi:hypothetical protein